MNEHRRQVLEMLAEAKINADEAERPIAATEEPASNRTNRSACAFKLGLRGGFSIPF
jgi:hypothetical protein